jgi:hypothetical protein
MQLDFIVTSPVVSFIARIGTNTTVLNSTVVTLPDGTYDYVIIVPASLTTPVTRVSVVITNTAPTNITGFTIEGCTGKSTISERKTSSHLYFTEQIIEKHSHTLCVVSVLEENQSIRSYNICFISDYLRMFSVRIDLKSEFSERKVKIVSIMTPADYQSFTYEIFGIIAL